jgi:L-threonylcarbamoyladenylate synthase
MESTIGEDLERAATLLRAGSLVAIPTETVYGLAANAYNADAVWKVFQAKQRPSFDPLIVHVHDRAQVHDAAAQVNEDAQALMAAFWPGPLTLVLPKRERVPDVVTSGLDTVALRMPAHSMAQALLAKLDFPLAAPSANPFGYVSPTTAQHVSDQLGRVVSYILDGGPCTVGVESTIIGWQKGRCVLYRAGGVAVEEIESVIGRVRPMQNSIVPPAPGMLESHYAPHKPMVMGNVPMLLAKYAHLRCAVVTFRARHNAWRCVALSAQGHLAEAARNLFATLRELDASDADMILAEPFPDRGLGRAINDRLSKAARGRSPS